MTTGVSGCCLLVAVLLLFFNFLLRVAHPTVGQIAETQTNFGSTCLLHV